MFAHTHVGTELHEPAGHGWRPHFHAHGHCHGPGIHHARSNGTQGQHIPGLSAAWNHDDDAVYLSDSTAVVTAKSSFGMTVDRLVAGSAAMAVDSARPCAALKDAVGTSAAPPLRAECAPIFLWTLSIRC